MKASRYIIPFLIMMTMVMMFGCVEQAKELTPGERAEIAKTIMQRNQDLLAVWAKPDAFDAWMDLHADENHQAWIDNKHLLVINHTSHKSKTKMDTELRDMLSDRTTQVTMKDESVAVLSRTAAIHFGDFTFSVTRNGETSENYLAAATTVWILEGNEWKILHYHQSWPTKTPVSAE